MGVSGVNEKMESAELRRRGRASTIYDITESFWIYRFRCQCMNYCHIPRPGRCSPASMDRSWVTEKMLGVEGIDILVTYLARKDVFELPLLGCQIHPSSSQLLCLPPTGLLPCLSALSFIAWRVEEPDAQDRLSGRDKASAYRWVREVVARALA
jgi:hypothetical protein